jgi:Phage capsid family
LHRDLSVTGGPSTGGAFVGLKTYGRSDLANWSAVVAAGALVISGLRESATFFQISSLPQPTWNAETGAQVETDPVFTGFSCSPKRLGSITLVGRQLLAQAPNLDEMLLADIGRQLGSLVDQIALLGARSTQNQPTGVATAPGVNHVATIAYNDFAHAERLTADQRIALDSYAVITSPSAKEYLQTTPVIAGYPVMIWDKLTNPKSSTEVTDNKAYCGNWSMLTIAIWGGLEIGVDIITYAMNGQVRLIGSLWVDVAVRLPGAFSVLGPLTA